MRRHQRNIIVKTLAGVNNAFLLTRRLFDPHDMASASFEVCPAIYQENIAGNDHVRLNVFGDHSYAALIRSTELDWRPDLRVPVTPGPVTAELHSKARDVLDYLGLEMGAIDLKLTPAGELVWLEVNPQGQFLFLDALTTLNLADRFADYLIDTAANVELV
jgi:glutathione synthase/RimK-type ligase-like ATP-grasp enzyme